MKRSVFSTIPLVFIFNLILAHSAFTGSATISGQEYKRAFTSPRVDMTHSTQLPSSGELHFIISHRFGEVGGGFYDMFGLDLATIRLGFDYGFSDIFAAGAGRSSSGKTYDLYAKTAIARQSDGGFPLAFTAIGGWSVNTLRNIYPEGRDGIAERSSFFLQLAVSRKQGAFSAQLSPMILRNNLDIRINEDLTLFAIPVTTGWKFSRRMAFTVQYIPVFPRPSIFVKNPLSAGIDIDTGGHQFTLLFSNSTGIFEKAVLTETAGDWLNGRIYFGFNLVRIFYLK